MNLLRARVSFGRPVSDLIIILFIFLDIHTLHLRYIQFHTTLGQFSAFRTSGGNQQEKDNNHCYKFRQKINYSFAVCYPGFGNRGSKLRIFIKFRGSKACYPIYKNVHSNLIY